MPKEAATTYQVVLTSQPAHDVTVTITHSGDGDIGIDDQELTFTDSDWETAQTVDGLCRPRRRRQGRRGDTQPHRFQHRGDYKSRFSGRYRDDETPGSIG